MYQIWGTWGFSPAIQERVREFASKMRQQNVDSGFTQRWQFLKNKNFNSCVNMSQVDVLNATIDEHCDIEGLVSSTIESIESDLNLDEAKFESLSTSQLTSIFTMIGNALTVSGFTNFCKTLSTWQDTKLLCVCFDSVILRKLLEKEEAALSTICAIKELGKSKGEAVSKCIIELLTNEKYNFKDGELLEQVFDVLPMNQKEEIIRAIMQKKNFSESNWYLLQVLAFKTSSILKSIIMFMYSKCDECADNQAFARLLVHICKNLLSDGHKDVLEKIIERNHCLLKHQAMKYLSAV